MSNSTSSKSRASADRNAGETPEVGAILHALIPGIQTALADNLVGIYLRGSLATGDFMETSDIDFLVATERPGSETEAEARIALHARLAALPNPYADRLEGAYIDRASLRRFEPGRRFLTVQCETPLRWKVHETSWLIERYVLRERGVTLLGPDAKTLIDPISPEELRDAVRRRIRERATWAANRTTRNGSRRAATRPTSSRLCAARCTRWLSANS